MNRISLQKRAVTTRRRAAEQSTGFSFALGVSFLFVVAVAIRGVAWYPEDREMLLVLLAILSVGYAAERLIAPARIGWRTAFVFLHLVIMVCVFVASPYSDFWALVMLPGCIIVMQIHTERSGWILIGIFASVTSVMQIYVEGVADGIATTLVYSAAFAFVGLFALLLKRTQKQKAHSDELLDRLRETHRQLQEYAKSIEELTSVRERNRIARDLHDSVTQTIFSLTLLTRSARLTLGKNSDKAEEQLKQIEELSQGALVEMRALIHELRPPENSTPDLIGSIENHVERVRQSYGIRVDFSSSGAPPSFDQNTHHHVFTIVKEALNNVVKHAEAKTVTIETASNNAEFSVIVRDDGIGLELARDQAVPGHMGLESMDERAREIGADLTIESEKGNGTRVTLTIPNTREEQ